MAKYSIEDSTLKGIGDSTRSLDGTSGSLTPEEMKTHIDQFGAALGTNLTEQNSLIAQLAAALEGKSSTSGGAGVETCIVTIEDTYGSYPDTLFILCDGSIVTIESGATKSFSVNKNSVICMLGDSTAAFDEEGGFITLASETVTPNHISNSSTRIYLVTGDFNIRVI